MRDCVLFGQNLEYVLNIGDDAGLRGAHTSPSPATGPNTVLSTDSIQSTKRLGDPCPVPHQLPPTPTVRFRRVGKGDGGNENGLRLVVRCASTIIALVARWVTSLCGGPTGQLSNKGKGGAIGIECPSVGNETEM